jgi:hypothetical protein
MLRECQRINRMYGTFDVELGSAAKHAPLIAMDAATHALGHEARTDEPKKLAFLRAVFEALDQGLPHPIKSQLHALCCPDSQTALLPLLRDPFYYETLVIACLRLGHTAYSRSTFQRGRRSLSQHFIQNIVPTHSDVLSDKVQILLDHWGYGRDCAYLCSWRRGFSGIGAALPTPKQALNTLKALEAKVAEKRAADQRQHIQQRFLQHSASKPALVFVANEAPNGMYTQKMATAVMLLDDGEPVLFTVLDKHLNTHSHFCPEAHKQIGRDYWPYWVEALEPSEDELKHAHSEAKEPDGIKAFKVYSQNLPVGMEDLAEGDPNVLAVLALLSVFDVLMKGHVRCAGD